MIQEEYDKVVTVLVNKRLRLGLTQKELAVKMNVVQSYISDLENQRSIAQWISLDKWAKALSLNLRIEIEEL